MADDFGLKIGLEGEKEFKKALADINQSFKVLGSEMELVASQFDKQDKSVEALTARNETLNKEIDAQKQKISTLEQALKNAAESFGENDKRTLNWQIQLNKAKAALNGMEKELDTNEKAIRKMSEAVEAADEPVEELNDVLEEAADTAEESGSKFENLGSIAGGIGSAIGGAVAAIGTAVVAAGKELITLGDDYNKAVNTISAATGKTGAELESLGETAKNVYTHNFGDSLEDVAQGLSDVQKTTGLIGAELEKATESGFALRDTFG